MRRRRLQFGLISLVVALIAYLVLMVSGLGLGLNHLAGSALLNLDTDAIAFPEQAGLSVARSELSEVLAQEIAADTGASETAVLGYTSAAYRDVHGKSRYAGLFGYDPGTIAEPDVVSGAPLGPEDRDALLADSAFLRVSGLAVGDTVEVSHRLATRTFTIAGEVDRGSFFYQPTLYLLRSAWQDLRYGDAGEDVPAGSVLLLTGVEPDVAGSGYEVVSKETAFARIDGVEGQAMTIASLQFFAYVIGALVVGVFFYVLTLQRVAQTGMLKAIGATSGFVLRQLLLQVFAVVALGLAVAIPLAWLTARSMEGVPEMPITLTTETFVTTGVALLVTAFLGALISGRQVMKTDPIIALGQQQ